MGLGVGAFLYFNRGSNKSQKVDKTMV